MPTAPLPVYCERCNVILPIPMYVSISGGASVTIQGCTSHCPRCGGVAAILQGVYTALSDTAVAITSGKVSPGDVRRLVAILESAPAREASSDQVAQQVKTEVPELSSIADVLPRTRNELYAFLVVLIGGLSLLSPKCDSLRQVSGPTVPSTSIEQVVVQTLEQVAPSSAPQQQSPQLTTRPATSQPDTESEDGKSS